MKKIKILVMNAHDMGGIEKASFSLKESLINSGCDVEMVSLHHNVENFNDNEDVIILNGKNDFIKIKNYLSEVDNNTVILSTYDRISLIIIFLSFFKNKNPIIIACQHADYFAHRVLVRFLRCIFYPFSNAIVALTRKDASLYKKNIIKSKVWNIGNSIKECQDELVSFHSRPLDIIAVGRLSPIKRFDHFVNIANNIDCQAALFGHGPEFEKLSILAKDKNVLKGSSKQILDRMGEAKILLVTSLRESFSMVIIEAMSRGCIVISYDCPTGPRELIEDGVNGFLINNGNINEMQRRCEEVFRGDYDIKQITENAKCFSRRFNSVNICSEWSKLIKSLENEC